MPNARVNRPPPPALAEKELRRLAGPVERGVGRHLFALLLVRCDPPGVASTVNESSLTLWYGWSSIGLTVLHRVPPLRVNSVNVGYVHVDGTSPRIDVAR